MNYEPRYLVTSIYSGEYVTLEYKNSVDRLLVGVDPDYVTIQDRALEHRASTPEGAWRRGYYKMRYNGQHILDYTLGRIERSAHDALDRIDDVTEQMRVNFERRNPLEVF